MVLLRGYGKVVGRSVLWFPARAGIAPLSPLPAASRGRRRPACSQLLCGAGWAVGVWPRCGAERPGDGVLELRCELYRGAVNRVAPALGPCPERCGECSPTGELAVQTPLPAGEGRAPGPGGLLVTTRHFRGATGSLCVLIAVAARWGMDRIEERLVGYR